MQVIYYSANLDCCSVVFRVHITRRYGGAYNLQITVSSFM